jgi:hypothetical protein
MIQRKKKEEKKNNDVGLNLIGLAFCFNLKHSLYFKKIVIQQLGCCRAFLWVFLQH